MLRQKACILNMLICILRFISRKMVNLPIGYENSCFFLFFLFYFLRFYLFIFRERGREGEREGEIEKHWLPLSHPKLGTWPAIEACAVTGNQTSSLSVCRLTLNPLSHTSQGSLCFF